jgi:deoxyribodipyrimidine photo-lyase
MHSSGIQGTRIQNLNDREIVQGRYVLYWMQQSQRAEFNHALEYAVWEAGRMGQGVVVAFGLTDDYPEANLRHYTFMLQGLRETAQALARRGIQMVLRHGSPPDVALQLGQAASLIVCDRGYLKHQRAWRNQAAGRAGCRVVQVEGDVVVPVEAASGKAEIGARTLRPKIHRQLPGYLVNLPKAPVRAITLDIDLRGLDLNDTHQILKRLKIDRRVGPVPSFFTGGNFKKQGLRKH